jgi:hypothetical protein
MPIIQQPQAVAQYHLLRLASARRYDGRPAFIRMVEAELTDDNEGIMLMLHFGDSDEDPSNTVAIFFDRQGEDAFDAQATAAAFAWAVGIANTGIRTI